MAFAVSAAGAAAAGAALAARTPATTPTETWGHAAVCEGGFRVIVFIPQSELASVGVLAETGRG